MVALSLWLIPPTPQRGIVQDHIVSFADGNDGPRFSPHVTVVGGIRCATEADAVDVANKLQDEFRGFGEVECIFDSNLSSYAGTWSQALFARMELNDKFKELCSRSRGVLGMEKDGWNFPPPSHQPHMSLFYGDENIPDTRRIENIPSFRARTMLLYKTDPPTLEGVPAWEELATVELM